MTSQAFRRPSVLWGQQGGYDALGFSADRLPFVPSLLAFHGVSAKEAQISSLLLRTKICRFAYAGGGQTTFLPPNGKVGSSKATRLISLKLWEVSWARISSA